MEIPTVLYGLWRNVKPRARLSVDKLVKGASWHEAWLRSGTVNTDNTPGFLLVDGASPIVGGAPHFQLFAPWSFLLDRSDVLSKERIQELLVASLQDPWGILSVISYTAQWALSRNPELRIPFLRAVVQHWPLFESMGERFSNGSNTGSVLWKYPTCIKYVLALLGVPNDVLRQPLPPGGLEELARPFLLSN